MAFGLRPTASGPTVELRLRIDLHDPQPRIDVGNVDVAFAVDRAPGVGGVGEVAPPCRRSRRGRSPGPGAAGRLAARRRCRAPAGHPDNHRGRGCRPRPRRCGCRRPRARSRRPLGMLEISETSITCSRPIGTAEADTPPPSVGRGLAEKTSSPTKTYLPCAPCGVGSADEARSADGLDIAIEGVQVVLDWETSDRVLGTARPSRPLPTSRMTRPSFQ